MVIVETNENIYLTCSFNNDYHHRLYLYNFSFFWLDTGSFEVSDVTPYSNPPELPEVMRSQENLPPQTTPELVTQTKP